MSFNLREENHKEEERSFTNFSKEKLLKLLDRIDIVSVLESLESTDVRVDRKNEGWISLVVRKE